MEVLSLMLRKLIALFLILQITLTVVSQGLETEGADPELYTLANQELLEQAQAILDQANSSLLGQIRNLATTETLLETTRQDLEGLEIPSFPLADTSSVKSAQLALEGAQTRLDSLNNKLALITTEKELLDEYITNIQDAELAAQALVKAFEVLDSFLLEISLRVSDLTLPFDQVPSSFEETSLVRLERNTLAKLRSFQAKATRAQRELEATIIEIEDTRNAIIEAEAQYNSTQETYERQLQKEQLEQEYTQQTLTKLLRQISQWQEERVWLKGTFDLSYRQFNRSQTRVLNLQQELEALLPPETAPATVNAETQENIEAAEALINYHSKYGETLKALKASLQTLVDEGSVFEGDARILTEHLFKMQVIATILENSSEEIDSDDLPENAQLDDLVAASKITTELMSKAIAATGQAKEQLAKIDQQISTAGEAQQAAQEMLLSSQRAYETALQTQEWESELKNLTAEQLVEQFSQNAQLLENNQARLQKQSKELQSAQTNIESLQQRLEILRDPLLRLAEQENLAKKQDFLKTLYEFAVLDLPQEEGVNLETDDVPSVNQVDSDSTEGYQNLLSTRVRIIEEQQKHRKEFLEALRALSERVNEHINLLSTTRELALQHYASAVELKKRLGRGQLVDDEIPSGITEVLKRTSIAELEVALDEFLRDQVETEEQVEKLAKQDQTLEEIQIYLSKIERLFSTRLDTLETIKSLEADFELELKDYSEVELQSLKRAAIRLLSSEDSAVDALLSLIPSEEAKELSDTLESYYLELIELKGKQENLQRQREDSERLIELAEEEKISTTELLALLQDQKTQLESEDEDEWLRVRAQLVPEKAEELLGNHEARTGRYIPAPLPILAEAKADFIDKVIPNLFEKHVQLVATNKWINLFEQKLVPSGINTEIGDYQDKLGTLDAQSATLQRRIEYLSGHLEDDDLGLGEEPKTAEEKLRFEKGEIGVIRADRYKIRRQKVTRALVQLISILLIARLIIWLANLFMNRVVKRKALNNQEHLHLLFGISFLLVFFKLAIWTTAFFVALSSLGFKVGTLLAGLGIGGLALAMAARETLANILGGIMIFIERPFKIGDVVQVGDSPVSKVTGMTWRTTRFVDPFNYHINIPNSQVTESNIINYTKDTIAEDYISMYVSAEHDPQRVISLANQALAQCPSIMQEQAKDTLLVGQRPLEDTVVMEYWPRWRVDDYHRRHEIRNEVWSYLWDYFSKAGIELEISDSLIKPANKESA